MTRHSRIDTTASAIIADADAFPPESTTPNKDDQRQGIYPLRIYEGYNYLPTAYGYKSYFGLQAELAATGLGGAQVVEELFIYQTRSFVNVAVALTATGIFIRAASDWVQIVALPAPPENTSLPWTYVTISNVLFMYRQGNDRVYVFEDIVDGAGVLMDTFNGMAVTPTREDALTGQPLQVFSFVPTTLNISAQIGLFRAGGSLGFWDSDDSVAWSAINDFTDFTPSLTTLANITKLQDQIGAITAIQPHGDGFIVYCTRSVLYAREDTNALLRYATQVVLGNVGVAYPREIAVAEPDTTHYAFTSAGLMEISNARAQPIVPDFSDYIKVMRLPQYMDILNNRYLCISVMDPNFIPGNIDFTTRTVDPEDYNYPGSEVGGGVTPGTFIPGEKVCFSAPGDEDDPEETILDSGVKPYHMLQLYRQWLYAGASIQHQPFELNGEEIEYAVLIEGTDFAAYDVVPLKMNAVDVNEFNTNTQIDKLYKRQLDVYKEVYDETILKLQARWDAYQAAKGANGKKYRIVGFGTVYNGLPLDGQGSGYNPLEYYAYETGRYLQDTQGNIYVYSDNANSQVIDIEEFKAQHPDYAGFVEDPSESPSPYYSSAYQWIGNVATTDVVWAGNGQPYSFNTASIADKSTLSRIAGLEFEEVPDERRLIIHPESTSTIGLESVDGAKFAYKATAPNPRGVEVLTRPTKTPHRLVRSVAKYVSGRFYFNGPFIQRDILFGNNAEQIAEIYLEGVIRGERADGSYEIVHRETSIAALDQTGGEAAYGLTSADLLSFADAQATMMQQEEAARNEGYHAIWDAKDAQYLGMRSALLSSLESQAPALTTGTGQFVAYAVDISVDSGLPSGTLFGANSYPITNYAWDYRRTIYNEHTAAYYPYIEVEENVADEREVSLQKELYGDKPVSLPATAVGATAIRQMELETRRGLMAVHQHFYNRNNSTTQLDASFLITAAGREDVPLGSPLGSVQEVIDDANFANRYYILDYNGVPPVDEYGASFVLEGQTTEQALTSQQGLVCGITDDIVIPDLVRDPIVYPPWTVEVPEVTFVLTNGSRAPFNPTLYGAYVFDLHLQKWGVFKGEFKHLIDYQPVNNYTPGAISYKNYMIDGGCLTPDLDVVLFNDYPADNRIRYGKYQHVGSEFCAIEQVHAEFKEPSSGLIAVQFSLDGRRLEYGHSVAKWYNEALSTTLNCDIVGRWATIAITGHFDLAGLRVKSNPSGRR